MRSGDKGNVKASFMIKPEMIREGMKFILFAGGVKMQGIITKVYN